MLVPLAAERFDAEGNLVDPATREEVGDLLVSAAWTRRLGTTDEAKAS